MSDRRGKTKGLELATFNPKESALFATKILNDLKIRCVLIGSLAVWYWLPDPAGHAYTKDLDTAIKKADRQKIIKHLVNLKTDFFHSRAPITSIGCLTGLSENCSICMRQVGQSVTPMAAPERFSLPIISAPIARLSS